MEDFLKQYGMMLLAFISIAWNVYSTRSRAAKEDQDKLAARMGAVEQKIGSVSVIDQRVSTLSADRQKSVEIHQAAFEQIRDRLNRVEETIKHSPSAPQVNELRVLVERMGGDIRTLSEGMRPLAASVGRIDDFLMGNQQRRGGGQ